MRKITGPFSKVGRKGGAFICIGVVFCTIGIGTLGGPTPSDAALANMTVLLEMLSLEMWYLLWLLAGLLCVVGGIWKKVLPYAAALASALPFSFAMGYFFASILGFGYRAWAGGLTWSIVALLMWLINGLIDPPRSDTATKEVGDDSE